MTDTTDRTLAEDGAQAIKALRRIVYGPTEHNLLAERHPLDAVVPDLDRLMQATASGRSALLGVHGVGHWGDVAEAGLEIIRRTTGVDPAVVFLFAYLHDTQRIGDDADLEHGARAADFATGLAGQLIFPSPSQLAQLDYACRYHSFVGVAPVDPTISACWDADRLNLGRVGITPDPRFLETDYARRASTIAEWASRPGQARGPAELWAAYQEVAVEQ